MAGRAQVPMQAWAPGPQPGALLPPAGHGFLPRPTFNGHAPRASLVAHGPPSGMGRTGNWASGTR